MKEKSSIKSICLPKSCIFASGSGEKSISVGKDTAMFFLRNPAKIFDREHKRQVLFPAHVFDNWQKPLFGYERGTFASYQSIYQGFLGRRCHQQCWCCPSGLDMKDKILTLFSCLRLRMDGNRDIFSNDIKFFLIDNNEYKSK